MGLQIVGNLLGNKFRPLLIEVHGIIEIVAAVWNFGCKVKHFYAVLMTGC